MQKKGDVTINWIILAAIGLLALVILGFIFKSQVGSFSEKYLGIGKEVEQERQGNRCQSLFSDRKCYTSCGAVQTQARQQGDNRSFYRPVFPSAGSKWSDCSAPGTVCCERSQ